MCKNTGVLHTAGPAGRGSNFGILADSPWPSVKNTENLQSFAAFWAGRCMREFWRSRFLPDPHFFSALPRNSNIALVAGSSGRPRSALILLWAWVIHDFTEESISCPRFGIH